MARAEQAAHRSAWFFLLALLFPGCAADHRIGLRELVQRERAMRAAEMQPLPPEAAEASAAMLDRRFGPYRIGTNDVLSVSLTTADAQVVRPPFQVRVDDEGNIELPLAGAARVADLTLQEAEEAVRNAYVPDFLREVSVYVELVQANTTNVLVVGAVTTPGLVGLRRTERNLLYAIVGAGGVTEFASGQATLRRIRRPEEEITLDLTDPVQLRAAVALEPLQDGDIIHVQAAAPNTVFVGGLVNRPSPQTFPTGAHMTVLQALAGAGGLRTDLTPREGTLIRRMPDGTDVHVKLNLDRLARAEDPNIELEPGDILWVPHTLETRVQEFLNRNLFLRAGATVTYTVTGVEFMNRRSLQSSAFGGRNLEDTFDPFGFLTRGQTLQGLANQP